MKFTWFHLMPYRYLPEDFKDKYRSVWVDIPRDLYDPKVGHRLVQRLSRSARICRPDGLRRPRRQRASSECLRPDAVAEYHGGRDGSPHAQRQPGRARQLDRALQSARCASPKSSRCSTCISGGRLVAGFPVGTSMDTNFCYGEVPATLREKYSRGARPHHQGVDGARRFRLQRQVHQAALRQSVAQAASAAPSADLDSGRRLGRDLGLLSPSTTTSTASFPTSATSRARRLPTAIGT